MRVGSIVLTLSLMAAMGSAQADDVKIATWTDANGVVHFGDTRFAPASAVEVEVAPANGMTVPAVASTGSTARGPVWTVIDQAPKQNKHGWRSKGDGPKYGHISPSQR